MGYTTPGWTAHWAAHKKVGALGAGSYRHLPSWAGTGPRKLGEFPSACQAAKSPSGCQAATSDAAGPSRMEIWQCAGKCLGAEPPVRETEHLGLPRLPDLLGQRRPQEVSSTCPWRVGRELCPTLSPLAPFPLLASVSNCCRCVRSQQNQKSMPVLHRWLVSQPPRVFQLALVSSPTNSQSPCSEDLFPQHISRARCAQFLGEYPLPSPFLFSSINWDWG